MLTEFLERVRTREAVIGVVGLGYVGLPLALRFEMTDGRVLELIAADFLAGK